jgi:hypothetical protein
VHAYQILYLNFAFAELYGILVYQNGCFAFVELYGMPKWMFLLRRDSEY